MHELSWGYDPDLTGKLSRVARDKTTTISERICSGVINYREEKGYKFRKILFSDIGKYGVQCLLSRRIAIVDPCELGGINYGNPHYVHLDRERKLKIQSREQAS